MGTIKQTIIGNLHTISPTKHTVKKIFEYSTLLVTGLMLTYNINAQDKFNSATKPTNAKKSDSKVVIPFNDPKLQGSITLERANVIGDDFYVKKATLEQTVNVFADAEKNKITLGALAKDGAQEFGITASTLGYMELKATNPNALVNTVQLTSGQNLDKVIDNNVDPTAGIYDLTWKDWKVTLTSQGSATETKTFAKYEIYNLKLEKTFPTPTNGSIELPFGVYVNSNIIDAYTIGMKGKTGLACTYSDWASWNGPVYWNNTKGTLPAGLSINVTDNAKNGTYDKTLFTGLENYGVYVSPQKLYYTFNDMQQRFENTAKTGVNRGTIGNYYKTSWPGDFVITPTGDTITFSMNKYMMDATDGKPFFYLGQQQPGGDALSFKVDPSNNFNIIDGKLSLWNFIGHGSNQYESKIISSATEYSYKGFNVKVIGQDSISISSPEKMSQLNSYVTPYKTSAPWIISTKVTSASIANDSTIALDQSIIVYFNKPMDNTTINANTVTVEYFSPPVPKDTTSIVLGKVPVNYMFGDSSVTLSPASKWVSGTAHLVTFTEGVKGADGKQLNVFTLRFNAQLETGIEEPIASKPKIKVYPNPASGDITIEWPGKASLSIYDIYGQRVGLISNEDGKQTVPTDMLSSGTYFLQAVLPKEGTLLTTSFSVVK